MSFLELRFHRAFDFFLSGDRRGEKAIHLPNRGASVKDIIESLGVPHTEVGQLLIRTGQERPGGEGDCFAEVGFDHVPRDQEQIFVHPPVTPVDITRPTRLRPHPFHSLKFVADVNVGALARLLLALGFDTRYSNTFSDGQVADIADREQRVVLTRDTGLLKRKKVTYARRVRENRPEAQLREVLTFFGQDRGPFSFFSRCLACNVLLVPVEKQAIVHRLKPLTRKYYQQFKRCPRCDGIFWRGSHFDQLVRKIAFLFPDGGA